MLLAREYRDEIKDFIRDEDESRFAACGYSREEILRNGEIIDRMWISYQKSVEEYSVPANEAFQTALEDVLGISAVCVRRDGDSDEKTEDK